MPSYTAEYWAVLLRPTNESARAEIYDLPNGAVPPALPQRDFFTQRLAGRWQRRRKSRSVASVQDFLN